MLDRIIVEHLKKKQKVGIILPDTPRKTKEGRVLLLVIVKQLKKIFSFVKISFEVNIRKNINSIEKYLSNNG